MLNSLFNVISNERRASIQASFAVYRKDEFYTVQLNTYHCIVFADFQLACVAWQFNKFFKQLSAASAQTGEAAKRAAKRFSVVFRSPRLFAALSLPRFLSALKLLKNRQVTQAKFQHKIIFFSKSQPRIKMFLILRKSVSKYIKYVCLNL